MKFLTKAFSLLLIKFGCAQSNQDYSALKIDYGYSTSTFSGISLNSFIKDKNPASPSYNYGWKHGLFLWINLNSCFAYRPEVNATFCVNTYNNIFSDTDKQIYSTSFGFEFKPQLIIRIGCRDTDPIIKLARNMSYYLYQKQAYLIIGPKFSYQKSDKLFLRDNSERNCSAGIVMGYGIDHLFPNLNVAPELVISIEYQTGNNHLQQKGSNRFYTGLSLAMNFF